MTDMSQEIKLTGMSQAIYDALYVYRTPFQWIRFTPFGVIPGRISKDFLDLDPRTKRLRKELR